MLVPGLSDCLISLRDVNCSDLSPALNHKFLLSVSICEISTWNFKSWFSPSSSPLLPCPPSHQSAVQCADIRRWDVRCWNISQNAGLCVAVMKLYLSPGTSYGPPRGQLDWWHWQWVTLTFLWGTPETTRPTNNNNNGIFRNYCKQTDCLGSI